MGYCRFQNTVIDLEECLEHILDDLSDEEKRARNRLVDICCEIADQADDIQSQGN